MPIDFIHKTN